MSIRAIKDYKDFNKFIEKCGKTVVYEKVEELERVCSFIEHNLNWNDYRLKYTYSLEFGFINSRSIPVLHIQIEDDFEKILFDCRISNSKDRSSSLYKNFGIASANEAIQYLQTERSWVLNDGGGEEIPF